MKQVKILLMQEIYNDDHETNKIIDMIDDWEEISDEDYKFLCRNFHMVSQVEHENFPSYGYRYEILVKDSEKTATKMIDSIHTKLEKIKEEQAKEAALKEKRKQDAEAKKNQAALEREKKLYEKLKSKFKED